MVVTGRGELGDRPDRLRFEREGGRAGRSGWRTVTRWAGPWPAEQRWWDPLTGRRRARLQVILDDHSAHLLVVERGRWWVEASYR